MSTTNLMLPPVEQDIASPNQDWNSRRAQLAARMQGVRVCHLSPVQRIRDERAFSRESVPGVAYGLRPIIVGPHSLAGSKEQVEFVSIPLSRSRVLRILLAIRMVRWALKQNADIYHVHSPELIPAGLALRYVFRKKVVYDSREDFPAMMLTKTYLPGRWRKLFSKAVSFVEKLAARGMNAVVTADPGSLRPLAHTGKSRKLVFYNFPNLRYFPATGDTEKAFDLVYRGGLSERAGTFVLLKALQLLQERGIAARLLLFGYTDNGQVEQSIRDGLISLGVERLVTLRGVIPHGARRASPYVLCKRFQNS